MLKFRGIPYVLLSLLAFLMLLLYRNSVLYNPLFLAVPFMLGIILAFMALTEETDETKVVFGIMLVSIATASFLYYFTVDFFIRYIGLSMFAVIGVADSSGMILLYDAVRHRKKMKKGKNK